MNSQDAESGPDSRPLTARKTFWIMLMCIQALTQFIIHCWTVDYGSDENVVSQVGFAGTLVSIALAGIAIVYAYFQTYSQKRDSDAVATRLAQMRELLASLNTSGAQIGNYAAFMEETQARLAQITTAQSEVLATAVRIEKGIEERRAADLTVGQQVKGVPTAAGVSDIAAQIVQTSALMVLLCFYTLQEVTKRNGTTKQYRGVLSAGAKDTLKRQGKGDVFISVMANWIEGIGTGVAYLLQTLKLLELTRTEVLGSEKVAEFRAVLARPFADQMPKVLERLSGFSEEQLNSISIDQAGIDSALTEIFDEK
ncbi:MAG: hypothetical protein ABI821_20345 [Pseudomonadota bacterium]